MLVLLRFWACNLVAVEEAPAPVVAFFCSGMLLCESDGGTGAPGAGGDLTGVGVTGVTAGAALAPIELAASPALAEVCAGRLVPESSGLRLSRMPLRLVLEVLAEGLSGSDCAGNLVEEFLAVISSPFLASLVRVASAAGFLSAPISVGSTLHKSSAVTAPPSDMKPKRYMLIRI